MNSILTLTDCEAQPPTQHANCCVGADHRSRIHLGRVWCWLRSQWGYAACEAYWILLCCCLKLATGCIGSGPLQRDSSAGLCQMLPGAPWGNLFGAISNPPLVASSAGLGCMQNGPSCIPKPAFTSSGPWRQVSKGLKSPRDLPLPAGFLLGLVTERASSCTPQQGVSSTVWGKRHSNGSGYYFPPG